MSTIEQLKKQRTILDWISVISLWIAIGCFSAAAVLSIVARCVERSR